MARSDKQPVPALLLVLACLCLSLASIVFMGCRNTQGDMSRLDRSSIGIETTYPLWHSGHSNAQVILTFSNLTAKSGAVVMPCPLNDGDSSFASSNKPTLLLIAKELQTQNEEAFILTDLGKAKQSKPKILTIMPFQSLQMPYALASFYRWGPCGPDRWGSILDYLKPGECEIAIRAMVAYEDIEPVKGRNIVSKPVVLKCKFPSWLFYRGTSSRGK